MQFGGVRAELFTFFLFPVFNVLPHVRIDCWFSQEVKILLQLSCYSYSYAGCVITVSLPGYRYDGTGSMLMICRGN